MVVARYKGVVDALAADIRAGRLASGSRLPTHRKLAAREGIALVTASRVYAELETMGLVSGEQGRGTFVRETTLPPGHSIDQLPVAADTVDLSFNYPSLPGQADMLRRALRQLANSGDLEALLRYQPHRGRPHERAIVATHLADRGLAVDADRILIMNGAQHGLATTLMAALQPGDVVAADALTYPGFKVLAHLLRLDVAALPVTSDGPDLDALERLCAERPVRAVYAMPTMHNPLGWVMSAAARHRLVDIARRHGLLLIEDAPYAYLADAPPPPLAALAPELTVYITGLSKSVATGLRVGFVCAPAHLVTAIERAIRATTWNTPAVTTAIACRWIEDGTVGHLEAAKRADAQARQSTARAALAGLPQVGHPSSYFVWLPLPEEARADRIAATLMREHITVSTAEPFATSLHVPQALRLALGSADLETLRQALGAVRSVVESDPYG
ncbi:MAG: PLP-dependent aminotransferase family protein [Mycobacterium sp.]